MVSRRKSAINEGEINQHGQTETSQSSVKQRILSAKNAAWWSGVAGTIRA